MDEQDVLTGNRSLIEPQEMSMLYKLLFDNARDILILFDLNGCIINANDAAVRKYGYTHDELLNLTIYELRDNDRRELVDFHIRQALQGGILFKTVHKRKDGSLFPVEVNSMGIRIRDSWIIYCIIRDVTKGKTMKRELDLQKAYFQQLFENSPEAIVMLDNNDIVININRGFEALFQYNAAEAKGRHINDLIIPQDLIGEAEQLSKRVLQGGISRMESLRKRRDGTVVDVSMIGYPIISGDVLSGVFAIYRDITERKKSERILRESEERYRYLSFHDSLTGLYNRAYFEEELKRLDNEGELPLSIIMGDVNGLKLANDVFGHKEGDKVLIRMAEVLKESCRAKDIIARWGGDEFVILLPKTDEDETCEVCEMIRSLCSDVSGPIHVNIALGTAVKYSMDQDIRKVLNEAEDRMYRNKILEAKSSRHSIILSLERTLYEADYETEEHAKRLQKITAKIGRHLSLTENQMNELSLLSVLHDIGKIGIPNEILMKPDKLNHDEWETMKKHPEIGYRIANSIPELSKIAEAILTHHERWDGKGYPQGLKEEGIPFISRLVTIADAYDVMTNGRPYQQAMSHDDAMAEIIRCSGSHFDPYLVEIFTETFGCQDNKILSWVLNDNLAG